MRRGGPLTVAMTLMALALVVMLLALAAPSPRTMGLFLVLGVPAAAVGIAAFGLYVLRDLRARRAL